MLVLLIAPNPEERDFLSFALRHEGLQISSHASADNAMASHMDEQPDMIILCCKTDEQVETVTEIRLHTRTPLMLIADRLTEDQHCRYLDERVDTVLQRPISHRLFIRYAKQLLRRSGSSPNTILTPIIKPRIQLDPSKRTVVVENREPVTLTQLEFRLLYVLMTNADHVMPTEELIERVWGYTGDGNNDLVRGLVRRLRRKIEVDSKEPQFIHNLTGVGYRFSAE